jgi:hypothetical protein
MHEPRNTSSNDAPPLLGLSVESRDELKRRFLAGNANLRAVARFYKVTLKDAESIVSGWKQDNEMDQMEADEWNSR